MDTDAFVRYSILRRTSGRVGHDRGVLRPRTYCALLLYLLDRMHHHDRAIATPDLDKGNLQLVCQKLFSVVPRKVRLLQG